MEPVKLQIRSALSLMLDVLPHGLITRLRRLHRSSKPGSTPRRIYFSTLNILRHRHLDPKVKSIRIDELDLSMHNDNSIITKRLYYLGEYEGREAYWWKH